MDVKHVELMYDLIRDKPHYPCKEKTMSQEDLAIKMNVYHQFVIKWKSLLIRLTFGNDIDETVLEQHTFVSKT